MAGAIVIPIDRRKQTAQTDKTLQPQAPGDGPMRIVGAYVSELRLKAQISQRTLGRRLGYEYHNFIGSVEKGRSKIPLDSLASWGEALEVDGTTFARKVLSIYEPDLYAGIFPSPQ
jgi:hypothetical protein